MTRISGGSQAWSDRPGLPHRAHRFVGGQHRVGDEVVVDDRGLVTVAEPGMPGPGRRVLHHGDLEALLDQLSQVALHAEIGEHPGQDDLLDAALAELQDEVVGLRPPHLVGAHHDRLAVLDVWLVTVEPVGAGAREPIEAERVGPEELLALEHHSLDRPAEPPDLIGRVEVVGRDEDPETAPLRGPEEPLQVLDGVVLPDTLADQPPGDARLAQHVVLRIDDDQSGVALVELHLEAPRRCSAHFFTCLPRKSRINFAISSPFVSRAKCPASRRWNSSVFRSRLYGSAPAGGKIWSFFPHAISTGGWCSRKYAC